MKLPRIILCTILCLFSDVLSAQELLLNNELYSKCYSKITDHPVEINSSEYIMVSSGELNPITACVNILRKAFFKVTGNERKLSNVTDPILQSILRNFHQFHSSWFLENIDSDLGSITAANFVDMSEPALFITDALFSNKHFKTVVTAQEPLRGLRSGGVPEAYYVNGVNMTERTIIIGRQNKTNTPVGDDFDIVALTNRVSLGTLIGITKAPSKVVPLPGRMRGGAAPLTDAKEAAQQVEFDDYDMTQHYGGGILGSSANFYNNDETRGRLDGGLRVHRRWANNTFYDLMCAKLPNLKENDGVLLAEVNQFKNSNLSFRQSKTCLSCHVTLDNFAHVARNIAGRRLDDGVNFRSEVTKAHPELKSVNSMNLIYRYPPTKPAVEIKDEDPYYYRRQPKGKLVYRDFNGKLINQDVVGLQQLGEAVAAQDDIYMCAAKRYYAFMTGIDVSMSPVPVDPVTKKPKDADKFDYYHRQIVVGLSKRLKNGASLATIIEDIMKTKAFKARNPATVGGG